MNDKPTAGAVRPGVVADYVESRLSRGRVSFSLQELLDASGLSVVAAISQLNRLGGRVVRVTRPHPFFLIVSPQHGPIGAPPVDWWLDDYFRWLGHPYYLALLSAAESYGVAPQAVQVHQVMTDVPRRELTVGRLRIRFFMKRRIRRTPVQQPLNAYAPLQVSTLEATVMDLVRYARRIGGIGRVMETIHPLLPNLRVRDLNRTLDAEEDTTTAQRLGYLFEAAGAVDLAETVHRWLPAGIRWVVLGAPATDNSRSRKSERWRVVVPEGGLP